eukprot:CAMPEP_0116540752 /NCGR_PEP_ID=MMETSP0397-20121206/117_1 /TAXON_ID=216820 /ORGANISM="Cyclophora tenuis, Strain ECT3854" /LENGTH=221 /DNA_ID=CAMNT_0004064649 /DNA_START=26 /DNA_END=691 /DNA_ORIENTATION=+
MYMAEAARRVEPALASAAPESEPVSIEPARPTEAPRPARAASVEPAVAGLTPTAPVEIKPLAPMSVESLRGKEGVEFESHAAVLKGAPEKNVLKRFLPFIFDERDFVTFGEVQRFVLVKGDCCFIFGEDTDLEPLYAIPLSDVVPYLEDRTRPDKTSVTISPTFGNISKEDLETVLLKYRTGGQAFQFTFNTKPDKTLAKRFYDAIENHAERTKGRPASKG